MQVLSRGFLLYLKHYRRWKINLRKWQVQKRRSQVQVRVQVTVLKVSPYHDLE